MSPVSDDVFFTLKLQLIPFHLACKSQGKNRKLLWKSKLTKFVEQGLV